MSIWFQCAALCWIVACVPPPGAWSAQPGWQASRPSTSMPDDEYTSESRSPSDDDEYDDSEDSRGSQGYDPRGSVGPRGSERVESPRRSGGSGWMCTAEASFGTANGDEPFDYSVERAWGTGATREAAAKKAFDDCLVLVNLAEARANINGQKRDGGTCTISQCSPSR